MEFWDGVDHGADVVHFQLLLKREMVEAMKPGSIIVDLAAETGGNCELTVAGGAIERSEKEARHA